MSGLLEKDFRLTLIRKQTIVIFFLLAVIMGASMDGAFVIGYLTMLATIMAVGTISYDEFDNGLAFLMTLPFDRKTYVKEKYLFCFLMAAAAWCIGVVLSFVVGFIQHTAGPAITDLPMMLSLLPALYISAAILIPLQLKYGAEKSRIVLFILFGCIAIVIFGINNFADRADNPFASLTQFLEGISPGIVLLALIAICAVITCISYLCSVKIMENKEF